jgi:porphobilinogen synthase
MALPDRNLAASYPTTRLRRPRRFGWSRRLVREHMLGVDDLIWPLFIHDADEPREVASMPGVFRWPVDRLVDQAIRAAELGIPAIAIFPATPPDRKTADAREALHSDNLVCQAVRAVKARLGDQIGVICDVALDPYTDHGHDGLVRHGQVINDETVEILCQQAIVQARAGCDVIAPSDMMDGRIGKIRHALDDAGFSHVLMLSYAAKYASAYYGPFRDAVGSALALGQADKKTYQMDPANGAEAIREVAFDIAEGADWVMVKPGLPYLDILHRVKQAFGVPTFVYQVSGEYAMIALAAAHGCLDRQAAVMESLLAMKRAGADGILTYFAPEVATWLGSSTKPLASPIDTD